MKVNSKWRQGVDYQYIVGAVFLVTKEGYIIGQHRDNNTINAPNKASFFGGKAEDSDATPVDAALRELHEETNIRLTANDLAPLEPIIIVPESGARELVYCFYTKKPVYPQGVKVYEGQGYHIIKSADDPLIAPVVLPLVKQVFNR